LRDERSLIQTIGRAARNAEGEVIMYADKITESMRKAIDETERRRKIQTEYNKKHGITPQTIKKAVHDVIQATKAAEEKKDYLDGLNVKKMAKADKIALIERLEKEMKEEARNLRFERAAELRDMIIALKAEG
jgi:excinuclease ABC subunit B